MRAHQLIAALLAALLVGSMVAPATAGSNASTSESIELTLEVNEEWTTVTVEHAGSAGAGANVTIDAIDTADAEVEGEYRTNADGTVKIPTPDSEQTAEFEVESNNVSITGAVTLQAHHGIDYTYTIALEGDAEASADGSTEGESATGNNASVESESSVESEGSVESEFGNSDDEDENRSEEGDRYDGGALILDAGATADADLRVTAEQSDKAVIVAELGIEADAELAGEAGVDNGSDGHEDGDTDDGDNGDDTDGNDGDDTDGDDGATVGVGL